MNKAKKKALEHLDKYPRRDAIIVISEALDIAIQEKDEHLAEVQERYVDKLTEKDKEIKELKNRIKQVFKGRFYIDAENIEKLKKTPP